MSSIWPPTVNKSEKSWVVFAKLRYGTCALSRTTTLLLNTRMKLKCRLHWILKLWSWCCYCVIWSWSLQVQNNTVHVVYLNFKKYILVFHDIDVQNHWHSAHDNTEIGYVNVTRAFRILCCVTVLLYKNAFVGSSENHMFDFNI